MEKKRLGKREGGRKREKERVRGERERERGVVERERKRE